LLEELGRADVAGMNDVVASRQGVKRLGADQAVGVGDQSDPRAERVNDFAAPDDINLVCAAVVGGGWLSPLRVG
jgi:hypothetical protein